MQGRNLTIFQKLTQTFGFRGQLKSPPQFEFNKEALLKTDSKVDFDKAKLLAQQSQYIADKWSKLDQSLYNQSVYYEPNRLSAYYDFESMEFTPEISAALDIYAEESTTKSEKGDILTIHSDSKRIKNVLEDLFHNVLDIHTNLPMWARGMCKYGDDFVYLKVDPQKGIIGCQQLPNIEIERLEGARQSSPNQSDRVGARFPTRELRFLWKNKDMEFQAWEIAHFRILGDDRKLPYGTSMLDKIRRIWKQLLLAEDAMLIYRTSRAPERRVFKVFVGNMDDKDIEPYVQRIANKFKRDQVVDQKNGQVDMRYNQMPVWSQTPIPLLDGRTITIEDLAKEYDEGKENWVYSIQDKTLDVVPGKVVWCGKNYTAEKLIKIWLDDNTWIMTAPEHPMMLRDGSYKPAEELNHGDSLMPFYTKKSSTDDGMKIIDYNMVFNPKTGKYVFTHRLVGNKILKEEREFNTITEYITSIKTNHKVDRIEIINQNEDVYCMTVVGPNNEDDRHNFALKSFNSDGTISVSGSFTRNSVDQDYFIPVRDPNQNSPIETLPGATNLAEIADIEYIQKKLLAALRIPKAFLGFEDVVGNGKGLALLDIRFARTINRIQQSLIQELNKIALVHLFILGFEDELNNFTLSMTNPSGQSDLLRIESWKEKITMYKDATSDNSQLGILPVSHTWAKKNILGMSNNEIILDLQQQRLERAIGMELQHSGNIIKRSGIFDEVDKKYGIPEEEREKVEKTQPQGDDLQPGMYPSLGMEMGGFPPPAEPGAVNESRKEKILSMLNEDTSVGDLFDMEKAQRNIYEMETKIKEILKDN